MSAPAKVEVMQIELGRLRAVERAARDLMAGWPLDPQEGSPFYDEVVVLQDAIMALPQLDLTPAAVDEDAYRLGVRDGYDEAVQDIDRMTGGDGEYRYCTNHDPERHTPDAETMILRIVDQYENRAATIAALQARVAELEAERREMHREKWCWSDGDPEAVYSDPGEYLDQQVDYNGPFDGSIVVKFGWGGRLPSSWAAMIPPVVEDGDWVAVDCATEAEAHAAIAAPAGSEGETPIGGGGLAQDVRTGVEA